MTFARILTIAGVAAACAAATPASALTNLVTNGSFSASTYTASTEFGASFGGQGVTGWTSASSSAFNLYFFGGTQTTVSANSRFGGEQRFYPSMNTLSADGGNFIALDGDPSFRGAVTQTITGLTAGQGYNLSFYWGGAQLSNRTGATTEQLQVSLGGVSQATAVLSNLSGGFTGWQTANFYFVAGGASQLLSFLSIGTPNGLPPVAVLDGVSLTAVPEPATWALLLTGFGLVGFAARRRRVIVAA